MVIEAYNYTKMLDILLTSCESNKMAREKNTKMMRNYEHMFTLERICDAYNQFANLDVMHKNQQRQIHTIRFIDP